MVFRQIHYIYRLTNVNSFRILFEFPPECFVLSALGNEPAEARRTSGSAARRAEGGVRLLSPGTARPTGASPPPEAGFVLWLRAPPGYFMASGTARLQRAFLLEKENSGEGFPIDSSYLSFNKCEFFSDIVRVPARMFRTFCIGERTCRGAPHERFRRTPRRRWGSSPVSGHRPATKAGFVSRLRARSGGENNENSGQGFSINSFTFIV